MASKVLSYGDTLLRVSDVDLLRGPQWLNDQVISFYFEYLQAEKYRGMSFGFCGGSLAYLLCQAGDAAAAVFTSLKLHEKDAVAFAVNDNPDGSVANGGGHWSLLIYSRSDSVFRHFDSARGLNDAVAIKLAKTAHLALGFSGRAVFESPSFATQSNGYDCGIYVLAALDLICSACSLGAAWPDICEALVRELQPAAAREWRANILSLIEQKAESQRFA